MREQVAIHLMNNSNALETLFKPGQRSIIRKLATGEPLDENERRYLRGLLGARLDAIDSIVRSREGTQLMHVVSMLPNAYITGFAALKRNGFGWYYDTREVVVMNTAIKGSLRLDGKRVNFVRVRSVRGRDLKTYDDGLTYATNAQVSRDARELRDDLLADACEELADRYGAMFTGDIA